MQFSYDKDIEQVEDIYVKNSSPVSAFCEAGVDHSPAKLTEKKEVYKVYLDWAEYNQIKKLPYSTFGLKMKKIGFIDVRLYDNESKQKVAYWEDIQINKYDIYASKLEFEKQINNQTDKQLKLADTTEKACQEFSNAVEGLAGCQVENPYCSSTTENEKEDEKEISSPYQYTDKKISSTNLPACQLAQNHEQEQG